MTRLLLGLGLAAVLLSSLGLSIRPADAAGYSSHPSYAGNCQQRLPGTVCIQYDDAYVRPVRDSITGWSSHPDSDKRAPGTAQVAHGLHADYSHILGTTLVYTEFK